MSLARLSADVAAGDELLFDSSALIAYFGGESTTPVAAHLLDHWVTSGRNPLALSVVSVVSVMEISVRPFRAGGGAIASVTDFLTTFPNLRVLDLGLDAALMAGKLRGDLNLTPPGCQGWA